MHVGLVGSDRGIGRALSLTVNRASSGSVDGAQSRRMLEELKLEKLAGIYSRVTGGRWEGLHETFD